MPYRSEFSEASMNNRRSVSHVQPVRYFVHSSVCDLEGVNQFLGIDEVSVTEIVVFLSSQSEA